MNGAFLLAAADTTAAKLDLVKVFQGAPTIYTILLALSLFACILCLYSVLTLRERSMIPAEFSKTVRQQLGEGRYDAAIKSCTASSALSAHIIASGLSARAHGPQAMVEAMSDEGRRLATSLWHRLSLLNDIAVISPMLGLLGTVLGMFFAFYDTTRTEESLTTIFDGLGIAIGTTVAGLIVAILALAFYTVLKFRVIRVVNALEDESKAIAQLIQQRAGA